MLSVISYSSALEELDILEQGSMDALARFTEDDCKVYSFNNLEKLSDFLNELSLMDILYYDITKSNSISVLESIREQFRKAAILLIADMSVSPVVYMKPTIMASSLLLRPINEKNILTAVDEILSSLNIEEETDEVFVIHTKGGNMRIPYKKILYFEARSKKLFLNTETKEYAFYGTLEELSSKLPNEFKRCHKGFIVNTKFIRRIALSQNEIELVKQRIIPISRSYKPDIKELCKKE